MIDPLIENLLDPLETHLADLSVLADTWQQELAEPAGEALSEREEIRREIGRYREENGLT